MSVIALSEVKEFLRVYHNLDDALLARLLDGAEDEALQYMDRNILPSSAGCEENSDTPSEDGIAPSVHTAVCLLVQAQYDTDDKGKLREAAETLLFPFRCTLGV